MKKTLLLYGMTSNEAEIYLTLLKKGPLNTYKIAEITGFHRGGLYDTIKRMQEKGYVSSVAVDNKQLIQAADPDVLADMLSVKLQEIESALPKLKQLHNETHSSVNIQSHFGKKILKILSRDVLKTVKDGDEVLTLGVDESKVMQFDRVYLSQYIKETTRRNIKERVISLKGTPVPRDQQNISYRQLPPSVIGEQPMAIYANKIAFFSYTEPHALIVIEDATLADAKRRQFEHFWKTAKH